MAGEISCQSTFYPGMVTFEDPNPHAPELELPTENFDFGLEDLKTLSKIWDFSWGMWIRGPQKIPPSPSPEIGTSHGRLSIETTLYSGRLPSRFMTNADLFKAKVKEEKLYTCLYFIHFVPFMLYAVV